MRCAWNELLAILPPRFRTEVDALGRENLQELRLRINAPPELVLGKARQFLRETVTREDLNFVVNTATHYSPWTARSAAEGYITATGGHRIGLCGDVVCKDGMLNGLRTVRSICIRVARDYSGIGKEAAKLETSILILGAPGTGKTTLLRDLIRQLSQRKHVCVVDERRELFPEYFDQRNMPDILTGCSKANGIEMLLRTMSPDYIAVDEITAEADCDALLQAAYCGVHLLATAHAGCLEDFRNRSAYRTLRDANIFHTLLLLKNDKTFTMERMS